MKITDLVQVDGIDASFEASSKKQLFQKLAEYVSKHYNIEETSIFDALLERERLGATGIGGGVAIPHGKIAGIGKPYGFFAKLKAPIDFESTDDKPVDLVFLLLAPDDAGAAHLKALACISKILRNVAAIKKIRAATSAREIMDTMVEADS